MQSGQCLLAEFSLKTNWLELRFVNGGIAVIHAKNFEGEMELVKISQRLNEFSGKSYNDILEANF
jgi:hypothetical protein